MYPLVAEALGLVTYENGIICFKTSDAVSDAKIESIGRTCHYLFLLHFNGKSDLNSCSIEMLIIESFCDILVR